MFRFLIIDDHPLFREALYSALRSSYRDAVINEARSLDEANAMLAASPSFDLALLDLNMPGVKGFEGLMQLRSAYPRLPVVIVSGLEDDRIVREALSFGIAGYIPKSVRKTELAEAISTVMDGSVYVPPSYQDAPASGDCHDRAELIDRLATLTPQQMRVLQMLRQGLLNKQIAHELQVGETTVKAHVSEVLRKLSVFSRTQAVIEVNKLDASELFSDGRDFTASRG